MTTKKASKGRRVSSTQSTANLPPLPGVEQPPKAKTAPRVRAKPAKTEDRSTKSVQQESSRLPPTSRKVLEEILGQSLSGYKR